MKPKPKNQPTPLRQRAEETLRQRPQPPEKLARADMQELIHELQVHQIELEMQNDELQRTQAELEAAHDKYSNLYDFAPVGYLTLDDKNIIREANLTATTMLGVESARLVKQPLTRFIAPQDQDKFYLLRKQLLETQTRQTCEVKIVRHNQSDSSRMTLFDALLEATIAQGAQGAVIFRVALSDITERKRAEQQLSVQHAVTLALSEAETLAQAMPAILKAVCEGLDWKRGECWSAHWSMDKETMRLHCVESCHMSQGESPQFETMTSEAQFAPGEGLPGRVFASGKPEWTPDIAKDGFARVAQALKAGYRAAFAFPVKVGSETLGVMTFLDGKVRPPEAVQLQIMQSIGQQIGQFVERKRAEQALKESESRYRDLVENTRDLICTHDLAGRLLSVNRAATQGIGYLPEELIGGNLQEFLAPDVRQEFGAYLVEIQETGLSSGMMKIRTKNGEDRLWEYRNTLRTEGVAAPIVRGFAHDVTERLRASQALKKSESRFRALIEHSADAIALLDRMGRLLHFQSTAAGHILGYDMIDNEGRDIFELIHPDDRERVAAQLAQLMKEPGSLLTTELRLRHKDGSWRWVEATATNLLEEAAVNAVVVNYHDITARKQAEEALRLSEERFRALIENSSDAVSLVSAEGVDLYRSPSSDRILGYTDEEMIGGNVFENVHPDDLPLLMTLFERLLGQPGGNVTAQFRNRHKNGSWVWLEVVGANMLNVPGVNAIVANYRDITARKTAEEKIAQSLREITTLRDIGRNLDADISLERVIRAALDGARNALQADLALFFRMGAEGLEFAGVSPGDSTHHIGAPIVPLGMCLCGDAARQRTPIYSLDIHTDLRCNLFECKKAGVRSFASLPLTSEGEVIGVLGVASYQERDFQTQALFLEAIALTVSISLRNALLHEETLQRAAELEKEVAERKQVEEERSRHIQVLESSLNEIYIFAADSLRFTYVNLGARKNLGYSMDELLRLTPLELKPELTLEQFQDMLRPLLSHQEEVYVFETLHRRKDGTLYPVQVHLQLVGALFVAIIHDITERKRAEQGLRESEERFANAFNSSPVGITITTLEEGRILDVNPSFLRYSGYTREEIVGRASLTLNLWANPADREKITAALRRDGRIHDLEVQMRARSGAVLDVLVSIELITVGNERCMLSVVHDVTNVRRAEQEARLLQTIALGVGGARDLDETITNIPRLVCEATGWIVGEAWIPSADGSRLTLHPAWFSREPGMENFHAVSAEFTFEPGVGLPGRAWQSHQAVWIEDVTKDPNFPRAELARQAGLKTGIGVPVLGTEEARQAGLRAGVSIPVIANGQVTLVLDFFMREARPQDPRLIELISAVAAELGVVVERKRAESALKKLSHAVEQAADMVFITDPNGVIEYVNPAFEQLTGYTMQDVRGNTPRILKSGLQDKAFYAKLWQTIKAGEVFRAEAVNRRKNGKLYHVEQTITPIRDERGNITHFVSNCKDVTARKQAEETLRRRLVESEAVSKISTVLRAAQTPDEMLPLLLDETLRALEATNGAILLYHAKTGDLQFAADRGWFTPLRTSHIGPGEGIAGKVFTTGEAYLTHDFAADPLTRPSAVGLIPPGWGGACIPIHAAAEMIGVLFVAVQLPREITPDEARLLTSLAEMAGSALHRLRLHAQTRLQAEQMGQVMRSVQDGILLLDDEQRLLEANPAGHEYLALLGDFKPAGSLGQQDQMEKARLARLGDHPLTHLLTPPPGGGWHGIRRNGRFFEALAHPLAPGPTARGWVLMVRDVTRQREAQEQLQRQERLAAVGQLAAGIAHDFNNLMGVILLQTQLLNRSVSLTPRERERLSVIQQQGRHAAALVGQILDFSRRAVLERQPLDLLPICKEQVKLLQRTLPEHIHIELTDEGGEYVVLADPTRMQQIVMNLAINARDAMPEGGNLTIGLARLRLQQASALPLPDMTPGDWVRITVSDTGSGIAPEVLPHIFEPFFTTKEPGKGTGLGLAQVYGIVGQHGGQITARSQVGQGATFTLYLPALAQEAEALPAAMDEPLSGNGELLLLVEDNEPLREALAEFLRTCHYRVATASSGEEALALLAAGNDEQPALVLSDLVMPRMGGKALLAALRGQGYRMPVIFVSGHPLDESELRLLADQGVGAWLRKPFQMGEMVQAIARCLSPAVAAVAASDQAGFKPSDPTQ